MPIDWSNGIVTMRALATDPGFLLLILSNSLIAIIFGLMLRKSIGAYRKTKDFPRFTLIPLVIFFGYLFYFSEAIQYYYLRPIAYYFLFLFLLVSLLTAVFLPTVSARRKARKLKKAKSRK